MLDAKAQSVRAVLSAGMIQGGRSGVAQYVLALTAALSRLQELRLTVFALKEDFPLFEAAAERGVALQPIPQGAALPIRSILWHQLRLPTLARRLGAAVIHVPSYRRLVWRKPCALAATIHDLAPFHVRGKYDPARMFYGRVVVRALARRQDRVIVPSRRTAEDVERFFGLNRDRVCVIHNGIDHERFHPGDAETARSEAASRWGLDRPFFVYVSRLEHPAKNHVRLIEAFVRFREETGLDWLLALAGSDWHGAEAIKEAARRSPAREAIRFLGFVPDEDLPTLYRAAAAMVYPSLFEGFGMPPLEAMACGCPVVCSDRGSLGEVTGEAAWIVDPESPDAIAEGLKRCARDRAFRETLRRKGLEQARKFDWNENARKVLDVYRAAAAARRGGA